MRCLGLGLGIAGSVSVATQGYLYAVGDAAAVLRAVVLQAVVAFAVTLPLLDTIGVAAFGVGVLVSSLVEAVVLLRATRARLNVRLAHRLVAPTVIGCVAAFVGWRITSSTGDGVLVALAGGRQRQPSSFSAWRRRSGSWWPIASPSPGSRSGRVSGRVGMVGIAVTGVGGGVGQSILKCLQGSPYRVVGLDPDPLAAGLHSAPLARRGEPAGSPGFVDHLLDVCTAEGCRLVFPGVEPELLPLALAADRMRAAGVTAVVSRPR